MAKDQSRKKYYFENFTSPKSEVIVPPGKYPESKPASPGPWDNQYCHCRTSFLTPTYKNHYKENPDETEPYWE